MIEKDQINDRYRSKKERITNITSIINLCCYFNDQFTCLGKYEY
jgi:hypothetical protein